MIKARKIALFEFVFERYNRWLLRRRFDSVLIKNERVIRDSPRSLPSIFCLNHSSWWDGLVAYFLSRRYGFDGYCMMEEKQLKKLRPFTWIGAFSVVREEPREAALSLRYAIDLLRASPARAIWIFPQGEILPNDARPIRFFDGAMTIARKSDPCRLVPIAIGYEFLGNYKPTIFIAVGDPIESSSDSKASLETAAVENSLTSLLDDTKSAIASRCTQDFAQIL